MKKILHSLAFVFVLIFYMYGVLMAVGNYNSDFMWICFVPAFLILLFAFEE